MEHAGIIFVKDFLALTIPRVLIRASRIASWRTATRVLPGGRVRDSSYVLSRHTFSRCPYIHRSGLICVSQS